MPPFKKCFKKLEKCVTSSSVDLGKIEVKNFLCKRNIYIYIYLLHYYKNSRSHDLGLFKKKLLRSFILIMTLLERGIFCEERLFRVSSLA